MLRVARFDGLSVLCVSGALTLVVASMRDVTGSVIGLIIAGAGAIELHGTGLLRVGDFRGMRWLVSSQAYLMSAILGYVAIRLQHPDVAAMHSIKAFYIQFAGPDVVEQLRAQLRSQGLTADQAMEGFMTLFYLLVAAATVIYQGGMIVYYMRRRVAVAAALEEAEAA